MWESLLVTRTDVPAEALWAAAADDRPDELLTLGGRAGVAESAPPYRLVAVTPLFLARAETVYEFRPDAGGTRVRVGARLTGPLAFLYRRPLADGLSPRVARLIERARAAVRAAHPIR